MGKLPCCNILYPALLYHTLLYITLPYSIELHYNILYKGIASQKISKPSQFPKKASQAEHKSIKFLNIRASESSWAKLKLKFGSKGVLGGF